MPDRLYRHGNGRLNKPKVGVSRCLLGERVRYDGDAKPHRIVIEELGELFELVPVCPEVEAGLSIPRPPVQLTGSTDQPRLTGRDNAELDITALMQDFCASRIPALDDLYGFILKSRSPSCGLSVAVAAASPAGKVRLGRGLFARAVLDSFTDIPVTDEVELGGRAGAQAFIRALFDRKHEESDAGFANRE